MTAPTPPWQILQGHAPQVLAGLPERHFHVCCTSPPYFALRSYLGCECGHPRTRHPGGRCSECDCVVYREHHLKPLEMGQEKVPDCFAWARGVPRCKDCYVCKMTDVFAAVRRVLRDDGTLWVNVAGSYCNNPGNGRGGETGARKGAHRSGGNKIQRKGPRRFRLRSDLTLEQVAYVLSELARARRI